MSERQVNPSAFAVLIGIDEYADDSIPPLAYAEKDCLDVYRVLTDRQIGTFPADNVTIARGTDANTAHVKRVLQNCIARNRAADAVLLYFSGHGLVVRSEPEPPRTYLALHDTVVEDLTQYPHEGLEMQFLHDEIFLRTTARHLVLVLDCCHSGAIVPGAPAASKGAVSIEPTRLAASSFQLFDTTHPGELGRIALVSCPADAVSRERDSLRNGVFTYHFLEGLRGRAANADGEVTLDSLMDYLRSKLTGDQAPGHYGHAFGKFVLTRPGVQMRPVPLRPAAGRGAQVSDLEHSLDEYAPFFRSAIAEMATNQLVDPRAARGRVLHAVRRGLGVDYAALVTREKDEFVIAAESSGRQIVDPRRIVSSIPGDLLAEHFRIRKRPPFILVSRKGRERPQIIVVPLKFERGADLLVLCGAPKYRVTNVLTAAVTAVVGAADALAGDGGEFEPAVYDNLRRLYGFLPFSMYARRYDLFLARLGAMTMHFQPVFYIVPQLFDIDSWEALARDPQSGATPLDLFLTAELWGRSFMLALDQRFSEMAVTQFAAAFRDGSGRTPELSINVYPQSLLQEDYKQTLAGLVERGLVRPERLVLEISEKVPLYQAHREEEAQEKLAFFKRRLHALVQDLGVVFAIDDFGVRQASVSHLARLRPVYVKIDRDALLHEFSEKIIRFVLEISLENRSHPPKVVVEGFDAESRVSLTQLLAMGVHYVQGFNLSRPLPVPGPLSAEERRRLVAEHFGATPTTS